MGFIAVLGVQECYHGLGSKNLMPKNKTIKMSFFFRETFKKYFP